MASATVVACQAQRLETLVLYRALFRSFKQYKKQLTRGKYILCDDVELLYWNAFLPSPIIEETSNGDSSSSSSTSDDVSKLEDLLPQFQKEISSLFRAPKLNQSQLNNTFEVCYKGLRTLNERLSCLSKMVYENSSKATTNSITVTVNSNPAPTKHVRYAHWNYYINITNEGKREVQLLSRKWEVIGIGGGKVEVEGKGVIGKQPILPPTNSFKYQSFTALRGIGSCVAEISENIVQSMPISNSTTATIPSPPVTTKTSTSPIEEPLKSSLSSSSSIEMESSTSATETTSSTIGASTDSTMAEKLKSPRVYANSFLESKFHNYHGTMQGSFQFLDLQSGDMFAVRIAPFGLFPPGKEHVKPNFVEMEHDAAGDNNQEDDKQPINS